MTVDKQRSEPAEQASGNAANQQVSQVLDRNISALLERRIAEERSQTAEDRIAGAISRFAGSMPFVYLHLILFGGWIAANLGWLPYIPRFDPSLVILAMAASVEAIFISTFVMINQNRMAKAEDKRAELSLQISLLAEHETSRLISLVSSIVEHFGVGIDMERAEIEELKQNVPPELVLEEIERKRRDGESGP
jgi:uncharacterized membrane protein